MKPSDVSSNQEQLRVCALFMKKHVPIIHQEVTPKTFACAISFFVTATLDMSPKKKRNTPSVTPRSTFSKHANILAWLCTPPERTQLMNTDACHCLK